MPSNPDTRPLPPGWHQHYDAERQSWYYVQINVLPPKVSYSHPANLNESLSSSTSATSGPTPDTPAPPPPEQRATVAPKLSAAQQLYANAISKKKAVTGIQLSSMDMSGSVGSLPALSRGSSSRSASSSLFQQHESPKPTAPEELYGGSVVAHHSRTVDPPHFRSASLPPHGSHTDQHSVPVENVLHFRQRPAMSSTVSLSQMNRDNNRLIITQPTIPGDSPTIIMTAYPPKQPKSQPDSSVRSYPPGPSTDIIPIPKHPTNVRQWPEVNQQYFPSSGAANPVAPSSSSPMNQNSGNHQAQRIAYEPHQLPSVPQPRSAPPYHQPPQQTIGPSETAHQRLMSFQQPIQTQGPPNSLQTRIPNRPPQNSISYQEPSVVSSSDYRAPTLYSEIGYQQPQGGQIPIESQMSIVPQQGTDERQHGLRHDYQQYRATNHQTRQHPNVYNQPRSDSRHQPITPGTTHNNTQYHRYHQRNPGNAPRSPPYHNPYPQTGPQLVVDLMLSSIHSRHPAPAHGVAHQMMLSQETQQQPSSTQIDGYDGQDYPDMSGNNGDNSFVPPEYALEPGFGEYQVPIDDGSQGLAGFNSANDVGFGAFSDSSDLGGSGFSDSF